MFSRRRLLQCTGALGAMMLLEPMVRSLRAETGGAPKRLLIFFSPLGAVRDEWVPQGTETEFTFGQILAPLEPFKSKVIVCDGIDQQPEIYASANHQEIGGILTGKRVLGDEETSSHAHISIDQFLAERDEIVGDTAFRSIELAAWHQRYEAFKGKVDHMYMSAKGVGLPVIPEGLPAEAFDRIFGGFSPSGDDPAIDPKFARRTSVLDAVAADLEDVQKQLDVDGTERAKIDQHLTSIRELEKRLEDEPFQGAGCTVPEMPGDFDIDDDSTLDIRIRAQIDIAIAALACDRTRIVSITAEGGRSDAAHPWLGITERYHEVSHDPHFEEQLAINTWYGQEFAYLLGRLDEIPDGDGTLLDNTCVVWVSEQGCRTPSEKHSRTNVPYLIAGSCGGHFSTGRFMNFGGIHSNSMLTTIMNAMGVPGDTFGEVTASPLPGITT